MDLERGRQLREDAVEGAGLDASGGTASVAAGRLANIEYTMHKHNLPVHWVALPDNNMSTALHSLNMRTQHRLNLVCTVAGN